MGTNPSLERFQAFIRGTQSAKADFEQKVYDRNKKLVQESRGSFSFVRPGKFRWAFSKPYAQLQIPSEHSEPSKAENDVVKTAFVQNTLDVKSKVHDIPFFDDVFLAF